MFFFMDNEIIIAQWIKVTDRLPEPNEQVLRYTRNVNRSQVNMALTVVHGRMMKYAEEETWWMSIPELPAPLQTI